LDSKAEVIISPTLLSTECKPSTIPPKNDITLENSQKEKGVKFVLKSESPSNVNLVVSPESKPKTVIIESKLGKPSNKSPKKNESELPLISKLVVPDVIVELVPPPPPKNLIEAEPVSNKAPDIPSPPREPTPPIPVFSLDFINVPKILPKHLSQQIPANHLNNIYRELRTTNIIMQGALLECSLKKTKKTKKACKALAIHLENLESDPYKNKIVFPKPDISEDPAVNASKSFHSELRQAQQDLTDIAKMVHNASANLNCKFDVDFKL